VQLSRVPCALSVDDNDDEYVISKGACHASASTDSLRGGTCGADRADRQTWHVNKTTFLTFSGPVQVPGASLPAGTYMFRLADSMSLRPPERDGRYHAVRVQIDSPDGRRLVVRTRPGYFAARAVTQ